MTLEEHKESLSKLSNDKYSIYGSKIGSGAFGVVYNCKDSSNKKKPIVFKVCDFKYSSNIINEINIFNKIKKHQNDFLSESKINESKVIGLERYFINDEYAFLVFEKAHIDLEEFIVSCTRQFESRLPLFMIKKIILELVQGIYEINYCNIIHCDIKMNNVLIKFNGVKNINEFFKLFPSNMELKESDILKISSAFTIKIIDLNSATFINHIYKSTTVQTTEYQAPEIIHGYNDYNHTIDVWSIGVIIWFIMTGTMFIDETNKKIKKYPFFISDEDTDESSDESSISESESSSSYYDEGEYYENYICLVKLAHMIGPCPKELIKGKYVESYYSNNTLFGFTNIEIKQDPNKLKDIMLKELDHFKFKEPGATSDIIKKKIEDIASILYEKIFVYDINKRISCQDLYNLLKC